MIVFVPRGDESGEDETRDLRLYEEIAAHLLACGVQEWREDGRLQSG